jgi:membrane protease YdiL (CAAX protease family)
VWGLGTLLTAGIAASVYLVVRPSREPAWGLAEVLGLTLFFILVIPLLGVLLLRGTPDTHSPLPVFTALEVLQNAIFIAGTLYIVGVKYRLPLSRIGLAIGSSPRRVVQGVVASVAAILSNNIGQNVTVYVLGVIKGQQAATDLVAREQDRIYRLFPQLHRPLEVVTVLVLVGVLVPFGEEIFFRGLAYGALRRVMNRHAAVVLSALFFAGAHVQPLELLPLVVLGMILAYLYDYTGSLVPGMIAHGVNNLTALYLFYLHPSLALLTRPV